MDAIPYKNGPKNQWRRSVWNLLRAHCAPGPILYLPGSADLDRGEAIRRGFPPADLIAVERDPEVAEHLRSKGATVIVGTLTDVLASWSASTPIGAVLADMQCGLDSQVLGLANIVALHPACAETSLVVNLQRGRDQFGKDWSLSAFVSSRPDFMWDKWSPAGAPSQKGRALGFFAIYHMLSAENVWWAQELKRVVPDRPDYAAGLQGDLLFCPEESAICEAASYLASRGYTEAPDLLRRALRHRPFWAFPAPYRSTPLSPYFDSVFIRPHGYLPERQRAWAAAPYPLKSERLRGSISAALALRTRRRRGELGGGYPVARSA